MENTLAGRGGHSSRPALDTFAHSCILAIGLLVVAIEALDPYPDAAYGIAYAEPCPCHVLGP